MPVDAYTVAMWLGLAFAGPTPPAPAPDPELLEFLGSFETKTGQWPELNEALAKEPAAKTAVPTELPPKKGEPE